MIFYKTAPSYRMCNCCDDAQAKIELQFRNDNQGTEIALCEECARSLVYITNIALTSVSNSKVK